MWHWQAWEAGLPPWLSFGLLKFISQYLSVKYTLVVLHPVFKVKDGATQPALLYVCWFYSAQRLPLPLVHSSIQVFGICCYKFFLNKAVPQTAIGICLCVKFGSGNPSCLNKSFCLRSCRHTDWKVNPTHQVM